jgi:hypothetical protein
MRNNPRDWRIAQLQTVARQFAMAVRCEGAVTLFFPMVR